jgi:hypothetical protein
MIRLKPKPIGGLMTTMAQTLGETQQLFADHYEEEIQRFEALADEHKITADNPAMDALLPLRLAVRQYVVELGMICSSSKEAGFSVGMSLNGTTVYSFLEQRYSITEEIMDRLTLTIESAPGPQHQKGEPK